MQFIYPSFLYALGILALPIIIHLFYFRRFKTVYFTNVKFLKEVKEETNSRQKLKNFLVLLMRLLAIAALVFAFAQPFIPVKDAQVKKGEKNISVFVDNSFSMNALSSDVPLLEKAKSNARNIISAYGVEDHFQILTNDFEGRHQRLLSQEDAISLIDEIKPTPSVRNLSQVLNRQTQTLNAQNASEKIAYVVSDFQKNITNLEAFVDTSIDVSLLPMQSVQEKNVSIDSAWFVSPIQLMNQVNPMMVKVRNYSDESVDNVRLSLKLDRQTKPVGTISIPANSTVTDTVNISVLQKGWHEGELNITDYPIQFDDTYFFTFNVANEINILIINSSQTNKYLEAVFSGVPYFKIKNENSQNIEYAAFPNYQLIILNDLASISSGLSSELAQYVQNGGNLLIFPSANASVNNYNPFLESIAINELKSFEAVERKVSKVNTEEFVFNDVFERNGRAMKLPVTQGNFNLSNFTSRGEEPILKYRDGSTYLGKYVLGAGRVYLCAAPLDKEKNDLVQSGEIFVPMLYKMAIFASKNQKVAYFIGKDEQIEIANKASENELVYKFKGEKDEFIPEQKNIGSKMLLGINNQIKEAGFYDLILGDSEIQNKFAFNYDRKESDLKYFNANDIKEQLGAKMSLLDANENTDLKAMVGERSRGKVLWKWFVIAALIFLALEGLILRLFK